MRTKNEALHKQRRAEILEAACACFIEKGLHQASMQEICTACDMSPGALYRFFSGKDAIILALAEQEREETQALMAYIETRRDDLPGALATMMPKLVQDLTNESYVRLTIELMAEASRNSDVATIFMRIEKEVTEGLIAAIRASKKAGNVRKNLDPSMTTLLLLSLLDGIAWRSTMEHIPDKRALVKTLNAFVKSLLC